MIALAPPEIPGGLQRLLVIWRLAAASMLGCLVTSCATWSPSWVAARVEEEYRAMADRGRLWPGFDPLSIPLAIYDGRRTFLFRHPSPPHGFAQVAAKDPNVWVYPGRYDSVVANSSAVIGGVRTGTVLASGRQDAQSPVDLAAVAVHEAFHVYQRKQHPSGLGSEQRAGSSPKGNRQSRGRAFQEACRFPGEAWLARCDRDLRWE